MKLVRARTRKQWKAIQKLYESAFPAYEKKPFWIIYLKSKQRILFYLKSVFDTQMKMCNILKLFKINVTSKIYEKFIQFL